MSAAASGGAGSGNAFSGANSNERANGSSDIVERYEVILKARALLSEAERVQMIMSYGGMENRLGAVSSIDLDQIQRDLEHAKLRVMHSSIESVVDLAVKVLVAAEDGFGSKRINKILAQDAHRIVAAA